jgi:DNA-binding PadR family transcriptional regulator
MSKNELVVLGLLNQKPMYGYRLHHEIETTGMEVWAEVNLSSIYNALNRLEQNRMVRAKRERPGKMPERSVYHITRKGKERLTSLLERTLGDKRIQPANLMLGIFFIRGLPKRKAIGFVKSKMQVMQKLLEGFIRARKDVGGEKPFPWSFFVQGTIDQLRTGIKKMNDLVKHMDTIRTWE